MDQRDHLIALAFRARIFASTADAADVRNSLIAYADQCTDEVTRRPRRDGDHLTQVTVTVEGDRVLLALPGGAGASVSLGIHETRELSQALLVAAWRLAGESTSTGVGLDADTAGAKKQTASTLVAS